jgi:hypothetical protein
MKILRIIFGVMALIGVLSPWAIPKAEGAAREYFVSAESGDDAAPGSAEQPFKTITAAAQKVDPGSIITVLPGWYEGGIVLKAGSDESPTILREAKRGRAFIGRPVVVSGFERAPGLEYTYVAPFSGKLPTLIEVDTGVGLRSVASIIDVEELAGGYFLDEAAGKVYIHPSDSGSPGHHLYASVRQDQIGVTMASNSVLDGFALSGFGGSGVKASDVENVIVQNTTAYLNGIAISLSGKVRESVVRGSEVWSNRSNYNEDAQIMITGDPSGVLIENNKAHTSSRFGIRFYSDSVHDCMARGNLVYGNADGFFYKVKVNDGRMGAENNIAFDNTGGSVEGQVMRHNTYSSYQVMTTGPKGESDLDVSTLGGDPMFADVAYRDYRLQSDSPARKGAPDGSDLGAFQYDGSVVYVSRNGNDQKPGTSVAEAWKTLSHALKNLKAGQTLYIEGGNWNEPLLVSGIKASASKPVVIRAHRRAKLQFPAITVTDCDHVKLQDLSAVATGIRVGNSRNVEFLRCNSMNSEQSGLEIARSREIVFAQGALATNTGNGIRVDTDSSDIALISTILKGNKKADLEVPVESAGFYSNFNAFESGLEDVRRKYGQDLDSMPIAKEEFAGRADDDFRVRAGQPLAVGGRYSRPVGPSGVFLSGKIERKNFERVEVISTTRTSANVTYWTPGRRVGTMIQWGETLKYTKKLDLADELQGEYETFHTVSMVGLKPATQYHYRLGWRHHADGEVIWSEDMTFKTAQDDPKPRQLYVSLEGSDGNNGETPATAWKTLHKAAREARAGDTVTIAPGRYMELLRPLQTGVSEDKRITFRAERPLSVFLDGGLIKFQRDGRSYCVQIQSKAFLTFQNLVCERVQMYGNGGYLSARGYAGLFGISGSVGIEIKDCVMDGRERWMPCIWANYAGEMPGSPQGARGFVVTDSLLAYGWRSLGYSAVRPCEVRNSLLVRPLTGLITEVGDQSRLILRNNVITNQMFAKAPSFPLWYNGAKIDSDYNFYVWDPENPSRFITKDLKGGLEAWKVKMDRDKNSREMDDTGGLMPLLVKFGFGPNAKSEWKNYPDKSPLTIEEVLLPKNSPARKAGENGEDVGPRWEKWIAQ